MRVIFSGVGEAFDERLANTSLLVETEEWSMLLDCGFTAATAFWNATDDPLELDRLYITHFHGDHTFGIPALLVRSIEEGRTKPLEILGQPGVEDYVTRIMDLAYSGTLAKAQFPLRFTECTPRDTIARDGLTLRFAENDHPKPCLSIRLDYQDNSLFYSGDGRPTDATRRLARGCEAIVHESFSMEPDTPGHGTIDSSIAFAREAGAFQLALVHIKRDVRRKYWQRILENAKSVTDLHVILPEPGHVMEL